MLGFPREAPAYESALVMENRPMQQSTVKLVSIGPDVTNCKALPIKYQPTMEFISPAVASPTGSNCSHLVWRRLR
jgi:hypothetical protein